MDMRRKQKTVAVKIEPPFRKPKDTDPRRMIVEQKVLISLRGKVGFWQHFASVIFII
jgi:hypothetical protein